MENDLQGFGACVHISERNVKQRGKGKRVLSGMRGKDSKTSLYALNLQSGWSVGCDMVLPGFGSLSYALGLSPSLSPVQSSGVEGGRKDLLSAGVAGKGAFTTVCPKMY